MSTLTATKGPSTYTGELPSSSQKEAVQRWMRDRGFIPNSDGTLRMCKVVQANGFSGHSGRTGAIEYKIGSVAEALDYIPHDRCGNGLHFAATQEECHRVMGGADSYPKSLVVDVDLESMVVINSSENKVKARWCRVVREGNEMDFFYEPEWE